MIALSSAKNSLVDLFVCMRGVTLTVLVGLMLFIFIASFVFMIHSLIFFFSLVVVVVVGVQVRRFFLL